jgi:hypothetical protein
MITLLTLALFDGRTGFSDSILLTSQFHELLDDSVVRFQENVSKACHETCFMLATFMHNTSSDLIYKSIIVNRTSVMLACVIPIANTFEDGPKCLT